MSNDTTRIRLSKTGKHAGKYEAVVDAIDSDLDLLNWTVSPDVKTQYAHRTERKNGKQKLIKLHRVILARKLERDALLPTEFVDHIDGNGLNNTRDNLRLATKSQNLVNQGKNKRNKSGYKGVYWHKHTKKWTAQMRYNKELIHLGYFDTKEEANEACIAKRNELHGEFANHS